VHRLLTERRLVLLASLAVVAGGPSPASGQTVEPPRTPWGAPDLGGVWDFRTITPLERPVALKDKPVLTAEEAAEFTRQSAEARNADRRDGGAQRDVERAYNDFWWDWGDSLTGDLRTSLIVDPPDGRIPDRTAAAQERAKAAQANGIRPVRGRVLIGSPAHGPEDLGLSERRERPARERRDDDQTGLRVRHRPGRGSTVGHGGQRPPLRADSEPGRPARRHRQSAARDDVPAAVSGGRVKDGGYAARSRIQRAIDLRPADRAWSGNQSRYSPSSRPVSPNPPRPCHTLRMPVSVVGPWWVARVGSTIHEHQNVASSSDLLVGDTPSG
jgi:hypothetical protein